MILPMTNKELLEQASHPLEYKVIKERNSANSTQSYVYENHNPYALVCILTAQAGSGDINNTENKPYSHSSYYNAGRVGASVLVKLNDSGILSLAGGAGSKGGYQAQSWDWKGSSKGWKHEWWRPNAWQVATSGEIGSVLLNIPPKGKLEIIYSYNGASGAYHKGSHSLALLL